MSVSKSQGDLFIPKVLNPFVGTPDDAAEPGYFTTNLVR